MTKDDTIELCEKYNIKNYTINSDMSVDVDGYVSFDYMNMDKIPLRFNKVSKGFSCCFNKLTNLKGCPKYVESFDCSNNKLTTLKGCPKYVNGVFWCMKNILTSLEGCPSYVWGEFDCSGNKLTSLEHGPTHVERNFYCYDNNISTRQHISLISVGCKIYSENLWKF